MLSWKNKDSRPVNAVTANYFVSSSYRSLKCISFRLRVLIDEKKIVHLDLDGYGHFSVTPVRRASWQGNVPDYVFVDVLRPDSHGCVHY